MTVNLSLAPDDEKKLAERAAASGQDVTAYLQQLIKKEIEQPSFAELFAPVHQAVRNSGLTDPQIDSVLQQAVTESRRERRSNQVS